EVMRLTTHVERHLGPARSTGRVVRAARGHRRGLRLRRRGGRRGTWSRGRLRRRALLLVGGASDDPLVHVLRAAGAVAGRIEDLGVRGVAADELLRGRALVAQLALDLGADALDVGEELVAR